MKLTKKLAGILLALAMVLGLAATAFAEGETGSITINDAVVGQTYTIYQILDLESYNASVNAYAYKATTAWSTFISSDAIKGTYVEVDAQGYVTWKDGADAAAFAKAAQKYAKDNSITNQDSVTATTTTVSFTGLDLGYYLVDSTLGTLCSLDTTNPIVVMEEKNEVPTNVKTVQEDSKTGDDAWGTTNDADIGQVVNFKSTITAQPGAENYVFHDTMSAGLTLDKASIKVEGVAVTDAQGNDVAGDNYTVSYPSGEGSDGCTFEIAFAQSYLDTIKAATPITITYSATLNENAKVGLEGNPNESKLSYGVADSTTGEPSGTTPPSKTTTYTWDMDVLKYGNNDKNNVLKDAKFVLLNSAKTQVATIVNGKVTGWTAVPTVAEGATITWPANTVLTTDANGKIEIDGLDADTYYLREVEAPAGYNKLAEDQVVAITGATKVDEVLTYSTVVAEINNQSGIELPSTGGIGTTIFYIVGGVLVVGAVVLLVTKKRMGNVER
ncbi:MAG: SpaH/EbpB family LPXTG-anchored major pilin [bacterium]|nr:SpaH/EbpB family LPXTG-anchored major pilin [bacterium]